MTAELLRTARIFVVDDEPANLRLLDKMLKSGGYDGQILIEDPRGVINQYRDERPDLILLDINMPHLDGYQVLAQLRGLNDPLMPPVMMVTAVPDRDFLLRAFDAGVRDFLTKPFDRIELLMRVRNGLEVQAARRVLHEQARPAS